MQCDIEPQKKTPQKRRIFSSSRDHDHQRSEGEGDDKEDYLLTGISDKHADNTEKNNRESFQHFSIGIIFS